MDTMNKRKLKALYRTISEDAKLTGHIICIVLSMVLGAVLYLAILINNM